MLFSSAGRLIFQEPEAPVKPVSLPSPAAEESPRLARGSPSGNHGCPSCFSRAGAGMIGAMSGFRVGIDSYCLQPLGLSHFQVLEWAARNGARGVQFSEGWPEERGDPDPSLLDDLAAQARDMRLYLEWGGGQHIPFDLAKNTPKDILASNRRAAEQARRLGAVTVRSCSGGLMRWKEENPPTEAYLRETARALREQEDMLRDNGVVLALETHFEFTTFELLRLFEMCGAAPGGCFGICLDTMNLLTMLEDPLSAAARVRDW
ncbi:MAG: sugar phosphate isomerase/epimerase, partial [Candidatus Aminicenantes bacterium]|nr:sugar phosphate isomerase/epimerase [Candidatus Aminicenantes bacterium]